MVSIVNNGIWSLLSEYKIKSINYHVIPTEDPNIFKIIFSSWSSDGLTALKDNNFSFLTYLRLELKNKYNVDTYYSGDVITSFENEIYTYIVITQLVDFPDEVRYEIMINLSEDDMHSLWEADIKYFDVFNNQFFCREEFFSDNPNFTKFEHTKITIDWCKLFSDEMYTVFHMPDDYYIKPNYNDHGIIPDIMLMKFAILGDLSNLFKLLYEDKNIPIIVTEDDPSKAKSPFAMSSKNTKIFNILYHDKRIRILPHLDERVYKLAGQFGAAEPVETLMIDKRTTKQNIQQMLIFTIIDNRIDIFKMCSSMLDDLSFDNNSLLKSICQYQRLSMLDILLKDPRFRIDNQNMEYSLLIAIIGKSLSILERLLEDTRFNPSVNNNIAMTYATKEFWRLREIIFLQIIQILQTNPRYVPSEYSVLGMTIRV